MNVFGVPPSSYALGGVGATMFGAFNIALHSRLKRDLAFAPSDVDIVVFEAPPLRPGDLEDFSKTEELIDLGYRAARQALDDYTIATADRKPADRFGKAAGSFVTRKGDRQPDR